MMKLQMLEKKLERISELFGRKLSLGCMRRCYRVEDHSKGEDPILGIPYVSAQELYDRLDLIETAFHVRQRYHEQGTL